MKLFLKISDEPITIYFITNFKFTFINANLFKNKDSFKNVGHLI